MIFLSLDYQNSTNKLSSLKSIATRYVHDQLLTDNYNSLIQLLFCERNFLSKFAFGSSPLFYNITMGVGVYVQLWV